LFHLWNQSNSQALNKLCQDGVVYKEKGRGTFVAKPKLQEKFIQRTYGFYQEMKEKGLEVKSKILKHELVEPPTRIKNLLKLTEGQKVVKTSRLRLVNKELIMFTTTYVRSDICPGLEKECLSTNRILLSGSGYLPRKLFFFETKKINKHITEPGIKPIVFISGGLDEVKK